MVKIKDGYVMSASEKAEFERVNALPRKLSGRVDYYYKPQTKYPPRIYVFMHAEIWCDRNRRPMGLQNAFPFLSRPMNSGEIEYHHFNWRLCYHQYEHWGKLIYAEEREAAELDKENPGTGSVFLESLKGFKNRYSLGMETNPVPAKTDAPVKNEDEQLVRELLTNGHKLSAKEIAGLLKTEQEDKKRLAVMILLRELYKNTVADATDKTILTDELLNKKVQRSLERTRRNFVRRVYQHNRLFALEEIRVRYPEYSEEMLLKDVELKSKRNRKKKVKPVLDLRRCQLVKLARNLTNGELDEREYHQTCCRIAMLQNAHNLRLPIPLAVTLNKETLVYSFGWRTREHVVKTFVNLANTKEMTHQQLGEKYEELSRTI